ncbi:hypothetical protein [Alkalibacterium olivapovliticus]|uniref:Uncharacterized protein n=1 Tax=Alkalibacterium olivapovliticus TaxID=99907 RepID=A0A2T0VWG5_9LACT|nr:hypothetical protein [Alkalibacterium olivapovliticus]PRY76189.1 hypothetical protein CLV38_13220 [Alkalibacterium olivapovliticus]
MDKNIRLIILSVFSFSVFAVTMVYTDTVTWLMVLSLVSFVTYMISIYCIVLNVMSESDSN